jgi:hypothetical protein
METNQERIIDKVRKLLAIGDAARNDSANERETAMRQAHALLAKHGLEMGQVTDHDATVDYLGALVKGTFTLQTKGVWEAGIYDQIARMNGCKCVRSPSRNGEPAKVFIFGRKVRAELIRQMSIYVVDSVRREARKQGHAVTAFGSGAWSGVARQVDQILANMQAGKIDGEQLSQSTALMVIDQHKQSIIEATRIRDDAFPRLTKGSGGRTRNYAAHSAGKEYGRSIGLNNQVGHSGARMIGSR